MGLFEKYYDKVAIQNANFEIILEVIQKTDDIKEKLEMVEYALKYAVYNNIGYFTSSILEKVFLPTVPKL